MTDKPRANEDERIISSTAPRKGAQIAVGNKTVSIANQKGTGLIADGQVFQIQADIINLMPRSVITIADAPLNEVTRNDKYSAEVTRSLGKDIVAGRVIWGVASIHSHLHGSIKIPSVYRSRYVNKIKELKSIITRMRPLLLAIGLPELANIALPAVFGASIPSLDEPEEDETTTE